MSRLLTAAITALLLVAAVPAFAQELPVEEAVEGPAEESGVVECENPDGLEVITRDGLESDVATPSFFVGNEWEYKELLVDLEATTLEATATVTATMTWDVVLNDYDLSAESARSSGLSENYQPLDPADETVMLTRVGHCEAILVGAYDYLAPVVVDSLALNFSVSRFVEPLPTPDEEPAAEPVEELTAVIVAD